MKIYIYDFVYCIIIQANIKRNGRKFNPNSKLNRVNFIATLIKNVYKRVSRKELLKRNKLLHRRSNEFKFCSFLIYFFSTNSFFKIPYECRFVSLSGKENPF